MDDTIRARLEAAARGEALSGPLTVARLVAAHVEWAKGHYQKRRDVEQWQNIRCGLAALVEMYGDRLADSIGAVELRASMLLQSERGVSDGVVNTRLWMARRCWRWGIERGLLPASVLGPLIAVQSLRRNGRGHRVVPVPQPLVDATLPLLPPMVAAMVRLQLAAAMRPGEVCVMRGEEIDTEADVWRWQPEQHKTRRFGKSRVVYLGPRCVDVLGPWYRRTGWIFPTRRGEPYSTMSYARAIARTCERHGIAHWAPNQLRHAGATRIRERCGLEAAQALLGHARIETTQVYAQVSERTAIRASLELG